MIRQTTELFVNENRGQRTVQRRADSANQFGFGNSQLAIVTGCCADGAKQRFLAFAVQPLQYIESTIQYRNGVRAIGRVLELARPFSERIDPGLECGTFLSFVVVAMIRENTQQANHRFTQFAAPWATSALASGRVNGLTQIAAKNAVETILVQVKFTIDFDQASGQRYEEAEFLSGPLLKRGKSNFNVNILR